MLDTNEVEELENAIQYIWEQIREDQSEAWTSLLGNLSSISPHSFGSYYVKLGGWKATGTRTKSKPIGTNDKTSRMDLEVV